MKRIGVLVIVILLSLAAALPVLAQGQDSLQLKGTLFTRSLKPVAIIQDTQTGQTMMYELGDILNGAEIVHIARGEVILKTAGGEHTLSFPQGGVPQQSLVLKDDNKWYSITRDGDTFIVGKDTVSGAIARTLDIMRNVRLGPAFINGEPSGVAVTKLTPTGILKELGIKEGDIVKSINGFKLNSPHQIFAAYKALKDEKEICVDIVRGNKPLLLTYKVE